MLFLEREPGRRDVGSCRITVMCDIRYVSLKLYPCWLISCLYFLPSLSLLSLFPHPFSLSLFSLFLSISPSLFPFLSLYISPPTPLFFSPLSCTPVGRSAVSISVLLFLPLSLLFLSLCPCFLSQSSSLSPPSHSLSL